MLRWVVFCLPCALLGCSPSDTSTPAHDAGDSGLIGCETNPLALKYAENLERVGAAKAFKFILVKADPGPPLRGTNTWKVKVTDASGGAVSGLTLEALPFMPEHGHGTSIEAKATLEADGTFTVTPLTFFMPGLWRTTLTAKAAATTDSAEFYFCVAG